MRLLITKHNIGKLAAQYICNKINEFKPTADKPFVLGLPTGSTPISMYQQLIEFYKEKKLSFEYVITFNMDEYVGLPESHDQSYHYYMFNNFFNHIDIKHNNIHILNGNAANLEEECKLFEAKIKQVGGIHLFIGGVGEDGHLAFNEPLSSLVSRTRIKKLNYSTILANSRFFDNKIELTPSTALTVGIQTVLDAQTIIILAEGMKKSHAVAEAIEGPISSAYPITALQLHDRASIICDDLAAYELRLKTIRYFENVRDEFYELESSI